MQSNKSHRSLRPFGWCVVLLLISAQSWGQETGCTSGNCVNGSGTLTWPSGEKYVGEFRDTKRHGQGTLTSLDGAQYVGKWKDYKYHGQGTFTYPDEAQYVGEWKDGKYHGQGNDQEI